MERNTSSSVNTSHSIDKRSLTKYFAELPDHVASRRDEIEKQIKNSLDDVEEKNEIVRGFNLLKSGKVKRVKLSRRVSKKRRLRLTKIRQVNIRCEELQHEWLNKYKRPPEAVDHYPNKICLYLQEQMNISFNLRDQHVRRKELADVIFYYLMRGEEPDKPFQIIIHRMLYNPIFSNAASSDGQYSWHELCCFMMVFDQGIFTQFYERLDNNRTALEYLIYKESQLLLNEMAGDLINTLIVHLKYDSLRKIIANSRDKNGQTCMFYTRWYELYTNLYVNHTDDLYEVLSVQNINKETALHVNNVYITKLLADIYTPKQRDAFIKLTSIVDNNDRTALQSVSDERDHDRFASLIRRVENNAYVTSTVANAHILIIYNAKNRPGAEEEAQTIYDACAAHYQQITKEKNKSEDQIIELITQTANRPVQTPKAWHECLLTSLIVILMSHGTVGTIDDCDGIPIKLSKVEEAMCSDVLKGRPKMLITQCCQNTTQEVDKNLKPYAPTHDDFCAVMSCVSGQKSKRGYLLGKLAEKINSERDSNIFKLVNTVSKEMESEGHSQTPIIMSTLRAQFGATDSWWW